jgi:integrase
MFPRQPGENWGEDWGAQDSGQADGDLRQARRAGPGRHGDGLGLYLQVKGSSKTWVLRYQIHNHKRWMGLGSAALVTLAQAREKGAELRRKVKAGIDPLAARSAGALGARVFALKRITFAEAARQYIEARSAEWRSPRWGADWLSSLERYAFPIIGDLPVAAVDTPLVHRVLDPVWLAKPARGSRVRERIEAVLDYGKVRGFREGENPARWKGHLEYSLAKPDKVRRRKHHAALPYAELPAFMAELRGVPGLLAARALELTILTAARSGEVRFAKWGEIDPAARVWTVPRERMKGGKEHRVPLSERALAILAALPREGGSDAVFPGRAKGGFINEKAMHRLLAKLCPGVTVHGFRSTFRDWAAETTGYPNHVLEMALAHAIGNGVEAAYRRGDLFEKRTRLMAEWAAFCASPVRGGDVVPLRA